MHSSESKRTRWLICLALAIATFNVYWRVRGFDFIDFDDPDYVTANPMVRAGLTLKGLAWAFTHCYADNWHPLTWISHMLDSQVFGLRPGGPHLVNVTLHAANAVLLFLLLLQMTGAQWRSAIVAALFALHPLHVESVAWISERKDVLSMFFALLTLLAYVRYARESTVQPVAPNPAVAGEGGSPQSSVWFVLTLGLFALGLMSKPMLVTLPFVMLLLDFWPLHRFQSLLPGPKDSESEVTQHATRDTHMLLLEKTPFFLLSIVSSAVTLYAQRTGGALLSSDYFPLTSRVENAIDSYFHYFLKACWPVHLAIFYPLEQSQSSGFLLAAISFLVVVSLAVLAARKRWPFLLMGWLWFLGTLVPVIGLVQVGGQAMADRYTYLPLTGLFIAGVWGLSALLDRVKAPAVFATVIAVAVLAGCAAVSFFQLQYWRDSITLFTHALAVTQDNALAKNNLGTALTKLGRREEALACYEEAVRIEPGRARYQNNLATALARAGRPDAAIEHWLAATRVDPQFAEPYSNLGVVLLAQHRVDEALTNFNEAVQLDPNNSEVRNNLGSAFLTAGKPQDALAQYAVALQLNPTNASAHLNAGLALLKANQPDDATVQFSEAVRLNPASVQARYELGRQLFLHGQFQSAREQLAQAANLNPRDASVEYYLGLACLEQGDTDAGLQHLSAAERLRPDWANPLNTHAWVLATSADDKMRNGAEALRLAQRAAELTAHQQPAILQTLAAAYAETGQFNDAIATAQQAAEAAQRLGQTNLVPKMQQAIELYKSRRPYRENTSQDK